MEIGATRYQGWTFCAGITLVGSANLATASIGKGKGYTHNFRCVLYERAFAYEGSGEAATRAVAALWEKIDETREAAESFFDKRGRFIGEIEPHRMGVCVQREGEVLFSSRNEESLIKQLREYRKLPKRT